MNNPARFFDRKTTIFIAAVLLSAMIVMNLMEISIVIPLLILLILFAVNKENGVFLLVAALLGSVMELAGDGFNIVSDLKAAYCFKLMLALIALSISLFIMKAGGADEAILGYILRKTRTRRGFFAAVILSSTFFSFVPEIGSGFGSNFFSKTGDKLGVSQEKLTFLANTSAVVISGAFFAPLVAPEVLSAVRAGLDAVGGQEVGAYEFIKTILPFSYFPICALVVLYMSAFKLKDIGGVIRCEKCARQGANTLELKRLRDSNPDSFGLVLGLVPSFILLAVWVVMTCIGFSGIDAVVFGTFGMVISSLAIIVISRRSKKLISIKYMKYRKIFISVLWSVLAFLLSVIVSRLDCYYSLVEAIQYNIPLFLLPSFIAVVSCIVCFICGNRNAALMLMLPVAIPRTWIAMEESIYLTMSVSAVFSGVMAGSLIAPHNSVNIVTSLFSGCNHQKHIVTQGLYSLFILACACVFGFLPISIGFTVPFGLLTTVVGTYAVYETISKSADTVTR